ncbi:MAG: hypothetical protein ACLGG0_12855 [Bacteriovoracia bacterium]
MKDKFREALFNEIKGSLFEYLTALEIARSHKLELDFLKNLPEHYQQVLEQQDHMTRELYPELVAYMPNWAKVTAQEFLKTHKEAWQKITLTGQLIHTDAAEEQGAADFILQGEKNHGVSLKLNKKAGSVNTKSGGIKSFFTTYFPTQLSETLQNKFNQLVDAEFSVVRFELMEMAGLKTEATWVEWRKAGLSELPGELPSDMRERLHAFYARVSLELRSHLEKIASEYPSIFQLGLLSLCGLADENVTQVICFHDIHGTKPSEVKVLVNTQIDLIDRLKQFTWRETPHTASVEMQLKDWILQIRIKPMNKFTTTAIKMNCSLRF